MISLEAKLNQMAKQYKSSADWPIHLQALLNGQKIQELGQMASPPISSVEFSKRYMSLVEWPIHLQAWLNF